MLQLSSASGGAVISPEVGAAQASILYVASDYPHGLFEFTLPDTVSVSEDLTSVSFVCLCVKIVFLLQVSLRNSQSCFPGVFFLSFLP